MANNLDCPRAKWICITVCSQGNECITCEYYPKPEEGENTPNKETPRSWIKTAKAASKPKSVPGPASDGGAVVIHDRKNPLDALYVPSVYMDDSVTADMESLHMAQYPTTPRKDHQAHALVYTTIWQDEWFQKPKNNRNDGDGL